jgi:hypothetical protein
MGTNPTRHTEACLCFSCLCCPVQAAALTWGDPSVHGDLPIVISIHSFRANSKRPQVRGPGSSKDEEAEKGAGNGVKDIRLQKLLWRF